MNLIKIYNLTPFSNKMKRTIDSYFGLITAISNKRPTEGATSSIQSTVFVNIGNESTGTSKPHFMNYFQKEKRHYNKLWEQKCNWLEYNE